MKHLTTDQDVEEVLQELHGWADDGIGVAWTAEDAYDAQVGLKEFARHLGYDL